ncbi:MAG: hypothetical protein IPO02_00650 [Bacteroidetes bacterium]|nr:hypothetical protein [Bacteroidota bacterium]
MEVGLLMNFGKSAQFKRKIFDNNYKFKRTDKWINTNNLIIFA